MTYVALIPLQPQFVKEHLTLAWCDRMDPQEILDRMPCSNKDVRKRLPLEATPIEHDWFGPRNTVRVAIFDPRNPMLSWMRRQFERFDKTDYEWIPHISAPNKSVQRPTGVRLTFGSVVIRSKTHGNTSIAGYLDEL